MRPPERQRSTLSVAVSKQAPGARLRLYARLLACVALLALTPSFAHANPELDAGTAAANDGRFEQALNHFERALDAGGLTRDELLQLLRERVLVSFALQRQALLDDDLRLWIALDPNASLGDLAPPALSQHIERLRAEVEPVTADVSIEGVPGGVRIAIAAQHGDGYELETRVGARTADSPWQLSSNGELRYPASPGTRLEYFAELRGPGGTVVAGEGTEDAPRTLVAGQDELYAGTPAEVPRDRAAHDDRSRRKWWWIGGAALLSAVAVAVGVGMAAGGGEPAGSSNEVQAPMVVFQ